MDMFSNAIKCPNCQHVLSRPVILPCGHSICKAHIEELSADDTIICNDCGQQHSNSGNFVESETLSKLIAQISSLDFGESHKEAKQSCDNLNDVISQIDVLLNDPDFYIHEFIGEFRRLVDLKHEEYKLKLEQETQRILAQLDKLEADSKEKIKGTNDFKELASAKDEAKRQLDEYLCSLNDLKVDEDKWKGIKMRCEEKFNSLQEKFLELKSCLIELDHEIGKVDFQIKIDIDPSCKFRPFKMNSMILINDDQKMNFVNLCEFKSNMKFELLYRGSRDGFKAQNFHAKCDNKAKTVTIVKSTNNNVFGGYTEASWNSSSTYSTDPNAFLFSLINQHVHPIKIKIDPSMQNSAIYNNPSYGPLFGSTDMHIASDCNQAASSYTNLGHTYKHSIYANLNDAAKAQSFLAGSRNFQVAEIEVYQII